MHTLSNAGEDEEDDDDDEDEDEDEGEEGGAKQEGKAVTKLGDFEWEWHYSRLPSPPQPEIKRPFR